MLSCVRKAACHLKGPKGLGQGDADTKTKAEERKLVIRFGLRAKLTPERLAHFGRFVVSLCLFVQKKVFVHF